MSEGFGSLTEKEKQTLRLIVRGHDAKSAARHLELSVHTVNERLREARRKMSVSSSREAARLLFEAEGEAPNFCGDKRLGEAEPVLDMTPEDRWATNLRLAWIAGGVLIMSLAIAIFALSSLSPAAAPSPTGADTRHDREVAATQEQTEAVRSAQRWLTLVDEGRWTDSWHATGKAFKRLNTIRAWASASKKARAPLGAAVSRTLASQESIPAPPRGYDIVKFRTSFAGKRDAVEILSLVREEHRWKVVGYWIS